MLNFIKKNIKSNLIITILADWVIGLSGFNFEKEYALIKIIKKDNPVILDIGAHKGESIKKFLKYKLNAFIHSFEPNKKLAAILKEKYKMNKKVTIYNAAVSNKTTLKLHTPILMGYAFTGLSSIKKKNVIDRLEIFYSFKFKKTRLFSTKKVNTIKIDELALEPDLIKIDTEGSEYEVLSTAIISINKSKPLIVIEYNSSSISNCNKLLQKLNYQAFLLKTSHENSLQKIDAKSFNVIKGYKNQCNIVYIYKKSLKKYSLNLLA